MYCGGACSEFICFLKFESVLVSLCWSATSHHCQLKNLKCGNEILTFFTKKEKNILGNGKLHIYLSCHKHMHKSRFFGSGLERLVGPGRG